MIKFISGLFFGAVMMYFAAAIHYYYTNDKHFGSPHYEGKGQMNVRLIWNPNSDSKLSVATWAEKDRDVLLKKMDDGKWDEEIVIVMSRKDIVLNVRNELMETARVADIFLRSIERLEKEDKEKK